MFICFGCDRPIILRAMETVTQLGSSHPSLAELEQLLGPSSPHWRRPGLYMGTLVATCHTPVTQAFYARLLAAGKEKKVALTACIRKPLTILNAMIRDQVKWQNIRSIIYWQGRQLLSGTCIFVIEAWPPWTK